MLTSHALLGLGLRQLALRYALAVATAYLGFFVLLRIWIAYASRRRRDRERSSADVDLSGIDLGGGSRGGRGPDVLRPGGGRFGGAGASADVEPGTPAIVPPAPAARGAGGGGWSIGGVDADEGLPVLIALAVLLVVVAVAGGYVVWAAPHILSEALFEAVLVAPLTRRTGGIAEVEGWVRSALRATLVPFLLVLLVAVAAGAVVQHYCPEAASMGAAVRRCVSGRAG